MRAWSRADPDDYRAQELHAHALVREAPLHDVWQVFLPRRGEASPPCQMADVRALMSLGALREVNPAVRALFALRQWLGRVFALDADPQTTEPADLADLERVPPSLRERSARPPGTRDGPFVLLYELEDEALGEIRNATVHAFSVLALRPCEGGQRLLWGIHVAPVGRITGFYMALIDPFRRWLVYPALLSHVHREWLRRSEAAAERATRTSGPN